MPQLEPDAIRTFSLENWSNIAELVNALGPSNPFVIALLAGRSLGPETVRLEDGLPEWAKTDPATLFRR